MSRLEFRVLGPVEVLRGGRRIDIGHPRQRAVLAVLLLDLNHVMPAEQLIDRVWGEDPPVTVRNLLYGYVAGLRTALVRAAAPDCMLARRAGGYVLSADEAQFDLCRFRRLAAQARMADNDEHAAQQLIEALALWRGEALTGLSSPWLEGVRRALSRQRMDAVACANDIRLRQGEHVALAGELSELIARNPADERLAGQLMLALYRCGRRAEALDVYRAVRDVLASEIGADPGPELQALHQQILRDDPNLAAPPTGESAALSGQAPRTPLAREVPRQLPAAVACFTGRRAELAALTSLLVPRPAARASALVISAIGGTAGVGKTALAVQWAHEVAGRFPDGQLYVNLRGYDPAEPVTSADALAGFLRALGVPGTDIPDGADDRSGLYRSRLAGRRVLVLLDNARDAGHVRPLLPGDPGCVAVVTSRDGLAGLVATDGAWRLDLDVLPLADAVTLLRSLIDDRVDDDPEAAEDLVRSCSRLPLALRLAAELAAARRETSLRELVTELAADRLGLLDAGEDQADVRAVFSWSVRQLPEDVLAAFALLGLHPGEDFDADAAAALIGTTRAEARRVLGRLARASLIQQAGASRYGMHDLLRAYAREQAAARDTDGQSFQGLTRLFDHYLAAAAAAMDILFPAEAHWRPRIAPMAEHVPEIVGKTGAGTWLDRERANLVAVIAQCSGHGWHRQTADLATILYRYLENGGHLPEAQIIYGHARHTARRSGDPVAEASALSALAGIATMKGRFRDAAETYYAARERYRRCGDRAGEARVLYGLGLSEHQLHNLWSAAGYYRQAVAASDDAGDSLGSARALLNLADVENELDQANEAAEHLQHALHVFREVKDQPGEGAALHSIGQCHLRRGQLAQAAAYFETALAIFHRIDRRIGVAVALCSLGEVRIRQGEYQDAIGHLRQALAVCREIGDQYGEIWALRIFAQGLHALGQPAAARTELRTALRLAAETGNTYEQACAHRALAESHHRSSGDEQARHHWQQALALYTQIGGPEADQIRSRLGNSD
jgi:DNA-binding SARP family transcriptional activator/tetratricopeptide (TPR) repeat protein